MKLVSTLALAAALAAPCLVAPSVVRAQDATTAAVVDPAKPNVGALTFSGGADLTSAYYFRGYLQENSGIIVQPYFGVKTNLFASDDVTVDLSLQTWNSLHSDQTGADGAGPDIWFENDIYVALPITFGKFTVTPAYYLYQYPNGAFDTVQEGLITVGFADADTWKNYAGLDGFALNPYVTVAYELSDGNGSEDGYAEVGITPSYNFQAGDYNIPLTFPIALGLSYKDYYAKDNGDNDVLGYISAGVQTAIPIPESIIPAKYGSWAVTGGAYYMNLFSDSLEVANNDASNVFWGKVGFSWTY